MQTPIVPSTDPQHVDAMIREARRQRSEYICWLIGTGWRALRRRLVHDRSDDTHRTYGGAARAA